MPQLECVNLSIGYGNNVIVNNLNFSVKAGDYLCILGGNGSGKSTLMKSLLGLQKSLCGEIFMNVRPNEIGYVPQQTELQKDFPASVWEVVLSGCQGRRGLRPFYSFRDRRVALETMERMKISQLSSKCYRELSGGQQQKVLLARALCATDKILFLDEPVAGLDPQSTSDMYRTIRELNQDNGITIIMISHDVNEALKYASHVLYMRTPYFFGTKQEYLQAVKQ